MKHNRIISICFLFTAIFTSTVSPSCRAQAISDGETVQLLRKIANLEAFLNDQMAFPVDRIDSETYHDATEYILFNASRYQEFTIDGDHVKFSQTLNPELHNTTTTKESIGLDEKGNRVRYSTTTSKNWVDANDVCYANNCMAHYSLYYLFEKSNPFVAGATCSQLPQVSILYNWLFMMCRYHLEETMVYNGNLFFHTEKTPEEFQERFVEMHQTRKISETDYDSIDAKVLDILDYYRLRLNSEIRVFDTAWMTFSGVKTDTIQVCLHKGELQKDDFDLSGMTDDEIAKTAYYVNAYPFAIALAYRKNIHITRYNDDSVSVDVPYGKVVDIVRKYYAPMVLKKTLGDNPFYVAP